MRIDRAATEQRLGGARAFEHLREVASLVADPGPVDGGVVERRDAIALALPEQIVCRDDCAGLCAECGKNLNDEPHTHEEQHTDSRWAALEALRDDS